MDRRERTYDFVEALRAAMDGRQAEIWTSLPGIVESFDPKAITVTVQPAVKGQIKDEQGKTTPVNLPLLVDVPVVFPCGGGFTLTHPIKNGDECLVVFASRCIDGWWQNGGIGGTPDKRMHELSDSFAIVGPRSQARVLNPPVDADNVQLRTDDGKAHITMMPDYTIKAENPTTKITMSPDGSISLEAQKEINLTCPRLNINANVISSKARDGGIAEATYTGNVHHIGNTQHNGNTQQSGSITSSGDQVAGGISQISHTHIGVLPGDGNTGVPQ